MKKFIILVIGASLAYLVFFSGSSTPTASGLTGGAKLNKTFEFLSFAAKHNSFEALSEAPHHTVIEVFSDSCGRCKRLEASFTKFQKKRPDVVIHKLRLPEGRMDQQTYETIKAATEQFKVCGTPHVVILDENENILVADDCSKKSGVDYLETWMEKEISS